MRDAGRGPNMDKNPTGPGLAEERFVSLTTFRRSGDPVATAVWVAGDGEALVVTTLSDTGKVKRLRHTKRVELMPCDRRGRVRPGSTPLVAQAVVDTDAARADRARDLIAAKYGLEYRLAMLMERAFRRGRRSRVILRITPRRDAPT
jgi:uncharacterized protein